MKQKTFDVKIWKRNIVNELPNGKAEIVWYDGSKSLYSNYKEAIREAERDAENNSR